MLPVPSAAEVYEPLSDFGTEASRMGGGDNPGRLSVLGLPASHRRKLRTTNLVERLNEEIRRRTRVARLFPNEVACLQLVSAILMEISEDWQTAGERYVVFNDETVIEGYPKVQKECCLIHQRQAASRRIGVLTLEKDRLGQKIDVT